MHLDYVYGAYGVAFLIIAAFVGGFIRAHRLICHRIDRLHDQ